LWGEKGGNKGRGGYWSKCGSRCWCCFFFLFFRCFFFRSFCCRTVFSVIRISQSIAIVVEGIITYLSGRSQSCVGGRCCFFFLFFRCFLVFYFRRWSRCRCCFFFLFFRCFLVFYFRRWSRCWWRYLARSRWAIDGILVIDRPI